MIGPFLVDIIVSVGIFLDKFSYYFLCSNNVLSMTFSIILICMFTLVSGAVYLKDMCTFLMILYGTIFSLQMTIDEVKRTATKQMNRALKEHTRFFLLI